ncbi:MAG: SDR family NAD(P)-dependent oxidoreductase [Chitinophagales bacterium]|nr:SDR family NAD(P)-dependent oxidoreductase [Chitinophagales bacterium]
MRISDLADNRKRSLPKQEPIAIIGIGCKYSDEINNLNDFWEVLIQKKSTLSRVPEDRFPDIDTLVDAERGYRKIVSDQGAWIKNLKEFDAKFFNISPREAAKVDPHQRLMLEVSYQAIEDAGLKLEDIWGSRTGVYAGMWSSDFEHVLTNSKDDIDVYSTTGSGRYAAAGRLAYFFNLQGPTFTIDTACSTSLVAIHLAAQSLHLNECDMALCSAANLILDPFISIGYSRSRLLSDYGRCKFTAKDPSGYVRTEGAATVVLKRLSDAQRDGDFIYGVIPGSACNSDGQSHRHMLAPSAITQEIMIKDALNRAHVKATDIQYVEAHGTGTKAGDPIEIASISAAINEGRDADDTFYVGSVKTNIGHTEAASGLAGLIKVILSIQNRKIPASLYSDGERNPKIPWNDLILKVPSDAVDWPHPDKPLMAGLNSFGISGTNAHLIIQEAPERKINSNPVKSQYNILPISALNEASLQAYSKLYLPLFEKTSSDDELLNLVKNISIRKADLPYRAAIIFQNKADIIESLQAIIDKKNDSRVLTGYNEKKGRTALVFPGQGAQWLGMGKELYEKDATFKNSIDSFSKACQSFVDWSISEEIFSENGLSGIDRIQPCLLAIEIALAEWWRALGLNFKAVIGHSMGEVGAAYLAGNISLETAAEIICKRSLLMKKTAGQGAMAYMGMAPEKVIPQLEKYDGLVEIGVNNSPTSCVISGEPNAIDKICQHFELEEAFVRKIKVDVASHSYQMQEIQDELVQNIQVSPKESEMEFYSCVKAQRLSGESLDAIYWGQNLRQTVQFAKTVQQMMEDSYLHFVEVSPHPTLLQPILENAESLSTEVYTVGSLERNKDAIETSIFKIAEYFVNGGSIHWKQFYDLNFTKILLPAYPWQKVHYWVEENADLSEGSSLKTVRKNSSHPFLKQAVYLPSSLHQYLWETDISLQEFPFLKDHKIDDAIVFPGAGFIEIIWAAVYDTFGKVNYLIENIELLNALVIPENESVTIQISLKQEIGDTYSIRIYGYQRENDTNEWIEYAHADVQTNVKQKTVLSDFDIQIDNNPVKNINYTKEQHYQNTKEIDLPYGESFQTVSDLMVQGKLFKADIETTEKTSHSISKFFVHPAILDGFIQVFLAERYVDINKGTFVPVSVGKAILHNLSKNISKGKALIKITSDEADKIRGNGIFYSETGEKILEFQGFELARLIKNTDDEEKKSEQLLYETIFIEKERPTKTIKKVLLFVADDLDEAVIQSIAPKYIVRKGGHFSREENTFTIHASEYDDYTKLFDIVRNEIDTVIHTWNIDETAISGLPSQENTTLSVVRIIKALTFANAAARLWVLTDNEEQFPAQATVGGLLNVVRNEHPELHASLIQVSDGDYSSAVDILLSDTDENSWIINDDEIQVERLSPLNLDKETEALVNRPLKENESFEVYTKEPGLLSNLSYRKTQVPLVRDDEVHVKIKAVGVNFMNLMSALGIYPGKVKGFGTLGIECVGVVEAVGKDVTHLRVGDRVMGMAYHTMTSDLAVKASLLRRIPDKMSFDEAATIPVVFLTAYYGLVDLARLQKAERVLIHSATGGVGLAAIQIAKLLNAEIFATAGSDEKREYLRSLGIQHVYDSRSVEFAEQIMQDTKGEGIDVVLNSLTGSAMSKSMELLRDFGRFIEIGKKDIYENSHIGLSVFQKGLSYSMIDFEKMVFERPQLVGELLEELLNFFENGDLLPLNKKVYLVSEIQDAFDYMSKAKHIGKVVIHLDDENVHVEEIVSGNSIKPNSTYLITGGYGALGLAVAQYLVKNGVKRLVLIGRSGRSNHPIIKELENAGAEVVIAKADVSERDELESLFTEYYNEQYPYRGVFHLAGILEDSSILNLDDDTYYKVISPKVLGAYNLHIVSQPYEVEHFVLFSSSTILFGSPGQMAYVAANKYMDALAQYRNRMGLPAQSVQWGTISEIGLAASETNRLDRLKEEGVAPVNPRECISLLDKILQSDQIVSGAFRFDVAKWEQVYPAVQKNHFYDLIREEKVESDVESETIIKEDSMIDVLSNIADLDVRKSTLEEQLKAQVAKVVKSNPDEIHVKTSFKSLGIDSLMSIQLKNQLEKEYQTNLTVTTFWTYANIRDYATFLLKKLNLAQAFEEKIEVKPVQEEVKEVLIEQKLSEQKVEPNDEKKDVGQAVEKVDDIAVESVSSDTKDKQSEDDLSLDELSKLLDDELNDLLGE